MVAAGQVGVGRQKPRTVARESWCWVLMCDSKALSSQIQASGHSVPLLMQNGLNSVAGVTVGSALGVGMCSKKIYDQGSANYYL